MSRAKYWVFTLNNYTNEELNLVDGLVQCGSVTYLIRGREEGTSGTPHLQGYFELANRMRISQLKQLGGLSRAHFEPRRGTQQQAISYCEKEEDYASFGEPTPMRPGKRTDLDRAVDAIKDGASTRELWQEHTSVMVRHSRGLLAARNALRPVQRRRTFPLEQYAWHPLQFAEGKSNIIWGESGIGKTSYLRSMFPTYLWVTHMDDLGRFDEDEYEGIVFDDMSFTHLPRTAQIHLVDFDDDRSIHIRYQTAKIPAGTKKVFTSNTPDIVDLADEAINRRVAVHHLKGPTK